MSDTEEPKQLYHNLTPAEVQKIKIENLVKKADKLIDLPQSKRLTLDTLKPPKEFQSNVSGSSAGAGSGEFHVYRAHRRKEYARLKIMEVIAKQEQEDNDFKLKQESIRKEEEERTAKKRAKRHKRNNKKKPKSSEIEKAPDSPKDIDKSSQNFKMVPNTD